jgi:hypothetical protein
VWGSYVEITQARGEKVVVYTFEYKVLQNDIKLTLLKTEDHNIFHVPLKVKVEKDSWVR